MSEGERPGGLTALAVINFVLTGFRLLAVAGTAFVIASPDIIDEIDDPETAVVLREACESGFIWLGLVLNVLIGGLLLASGVGYLRQKKILGRVLGSTYAILALVAIVLGSTIGKTFSFLMLIDVVYPLLTLILLNTIFKDDLIN